MAAILLGGLTFSQAAFAGQSGGGPPGKVTICHVDQETGEEITITVGAPAVPAHLAHGDTLGPCVDEPSTCEELCVEEFDACFEGCQGDSFCEGICEFFHSECVISCTV